MELKSTVSAVFLLLLLLATPRISRGSSATPATEVHPIDTEVYPIDTEFTCLI
ncbi:hypothetical protein SLEP1_g17655 [Rubroshorea leprosula]|uniref:Uncharacterized protein n=1 Tax=Rubroshorea leprosula TaxID=152421 RepID=A0AAV5J5K1_9ROSI|nr:hypothetical protein SLEP1_g17655 [Rubroshorea leprosula]